jgi:hypothetical protein
MALLSLQNSLSLSRTFLKSRIDKCEIQTQHFNTSEFFYIIIIQNLTQVINNFSKIWQNRK